MSYRRVFAGLLGLLLLCCGGSDSVAQTDPLTTDSSSPSTSVAPTAAITGVDPYPSMPEPFFRGYPPGANQTGSGWYISILKLLPLLLVFYIWVSVSRWVHEDSEHLKARPEFWTTTLLLVGVFGFLAVLVVPWFLVGFPVMLAFVLIPMFVYVNERNQKVPENRQVLTKRHLNEVLARLGLRSGGREKSEPVVGPNIRFIGKSDGRGDSAGSRARQVQNSRGFMAAKELVYDSIVRRATDIHLEPKEKEVSVRVRIDGVMYPTDPFDDQTGLAVVNIFKVLGAMDITERRRPQDGSFQAIMDGRNIDFRVASQGTRFGEKLSLRILDQSSSVSGLKGLGFRKALMDQMTEVTNLPHGMFIVCGPTGAGKSTTLYAALNSIDSFQKNVITVEDPVEYKMENVNQIEVNTRAGQTFAASLRSMLRQDPDVVMIGEIRDGETAGIACQAANTGHLVFSTIHANDSITALYRFLELDVEPFMVANSISGILAQRLARRLCPDCREAYRPSADLLKKLGLPAEKVTKFYRPPTNPEHTCGNCGGLGFKGRIGVFELFMVNDRIRDLIRDTASMSEIKSEARKNGMLYMKEEGLRLVVKGVTSYDELARVVK